MSNALNARFAALSPQQLNQLDARFEEASGTVSSEPIAIVGMACRFPGGANDPQGFWDLMETGRDGTSYLSDSRWRDFGIDEQGLKGHVIDTIRRGGFLKDVRSFDAAFFGISGREARSMDPQQRLLLEVAYEALADAGVSPDSLRGSQTGVFCGIAMSEYLHRTTAQGAPADMYAVTGGIHGTATGRISYQWDLRGPAVSLDTTCSSSLTAVHLARQSLLLRESEVALAGGVNLILDAGMSISLAELGILSPDGRCKTFDESGNGYGRGEGCGVVVLKRLTDAITAGDRVLAVIRATGARQDGRSNGLIAPSGTAQRELMLATLRQSGVDASQLGLIETHGTGTALGDPIEIGALADVYGKGLAGTCALNAVKASIGHTEAAAGVAGLISAVLCLRKGRIPGQQHLGKVNPEIDLGEGRLFIPRRPTIWPQPDGPRMAAVSSFGASGTIVHVILEEAPEPPSAKQSHTGPRLFTLSAATAGALTSAAERLASDLETRLQTGANDLADMGYTLARKRQRLPERVTVVASTHAELAGALRHAARGMSSPAISRGRAPVKARSGAVWVFSGQGAHWASMGRELLAEQPVFVAAIDEIEPIVQREMGFSLRAILADCELPAAGNDTAWAPLAAFAMHLGLAAVLRDLGLHPAAVIGCSIGELAAAVTAGALSAVTAARIACLRTRLVERNLAGDGVTAVVGLSPDQVTELLSGTPGVWMSGHLSPQATMVSGRRAEMDELLASLVADGVYVQSAPGMRFAAHSPDIDPLLPELSDFLREVPAGLTTVPMYSTSQILTDGAVAPLYWAANLREPVDLHGAIVAALADGRRDFIEFSAHPTLLKPIEDTLRAEGIADRLVMGVLTADQPAWASILSTLGALHCRGTELDWSRLYPSGRLATLPAYAWQREDYWVETRPGRHVATERAHPLLGTSMRLPFSPPVDVWQTRIGATGRTWLADHRVGGVAVLAAPLMCEMALAAAVKALSAEPDDIAMTDCDFRQVLPLGQSQPVTTSVSASKKTSEGRAATVEIRTAAAGNPVVHATMSVRVGNVPPVESPATPDLTDWHPVDRDGFYRTLEVGGADLGVYFRPLDGIRVSPDGARTHAVIRPCIDDGEGADGLYFHPAMLTACLQAALALPAATSIVSEVFMLTHIAELKRLGECRTAVSCRATLVKVVEGESIEADAELLGPVGEVLVFARGVRCAQVPRAAMIARPPMRQGELIGERTGEHVGLTGKRLRQAVLKAVSQEACGILELAAPPDPDVSLAGYGMDSITAMELQGRLAARFGVEIPLIAILALPGVGELSESLSALIEGAS